jgi:CheY-like chemotaxis protein
MSHSIRPSIHRANVHLHVLVIDDDDSAREFMCDVLRQAGFTAEGQASTIGVTNRVIRDHFQVVVLDLLMPALRGDKLAALLRKNHQLKHLGIVFVSSASKEELDVLATDHGADAVIRKEDARESLADAVQQAANIRSSSPGDPVKR